MIPQDIDLVVGIPRSGLLAANILALYLNKPITDLDGLIEGRMLSKGKRVVANFNGDIIGSARKILIFDDCISWGTEINKARQRVEEAGLIDRAVFGCVYSFPENPHLADFVMEMIPRPMTFQWSCLYTPELKRVCVDIDGILCHDCPKDQDDDGPGYLDFLENATPLFLPTHEVRWLVTSRLEKYREQTERWLAKHNVPYQDLIMMDVATPAERAKNGAHRKFKADFFKSQKEARLFIESCPRSAREIYELTGKPALCPVNATMYGASGSEQIEIFKQKTGLKRLLKRIKGAPNKLVREARALVRA
ncbi:MAG: phosphoribosyltransferase [Planctomycetota bacterium]